MYESRDLRPMLGLDALIASAVAQHYRLNFARTARTLFPSGAGLRQVENLIRA